MSYGIGLWEDDCRDLIHVSLSCTIEVSVPKEGKLERRDTGDTFRIELAETTDYTLRVENLTASSTYTFYLAKIEHLRRRTLVRVAQRRGIGGLGPSETKEISFTSFEAGTYFFEINLGIYSAESDWGVNPVSEERNYRIQISEPPP